MSSVLEVAAAIRNLGIPPSFETLIDLCTANARRATNGSTAFPTFRDTPAIIGNAGINRLPRDGSSARFNPPCTRGDEALSKSRAVMRRKRGVMLSVSAAALLCIFAAPTASGAEPSLAAMWELRLLGIDDADKLDELCDFAKRRRVKLGLVAQGGVSGKSLGEFLGLGNTITYHGCRDPGRSTHDTGQLRVILELTSALGVEVDVHVWQPGQSLQDVADRFRETAGVCDVVCFYQSFWGRDAASVTRAIRESPSVLFVSPYVEYQSKPTSEAPQGSACKPWVPGSIGHFVLAVPLARRDLKGRILTPSDRGPTDSEAINFIAPSYHASGPGGTCPAGATTTACALYLYTVMPGKPSPADVVELLRTTSGVDRKLLTSVGKLDEAVVEDLEKKIAGLRTPASGKQRKLDAPGVLNLFRAHRKAVITEQSDAPDK